MGVRVCVYMCVYLCVCVCMCACIVKVNIVLSIWHNNVLSYYVSFLL